MLDSLGNYVYALVDPELDKIFYVGKAGKGFKGKLNVRPTKHFDFKEPKGDKEYYIAGLIEKGYVKDEIIHVIRHNLADEAVLNVEAAVIDAIGIENLTNAKLGDKVEHGRMPWSEVNMRFGSKLVDWKKLQEFADQRGVRLTLIHIKKSYRPNMSAVELYDATRGYWKIARHKASLDKPTFALCCLGDTILEVYRIEAWLPAGSTVSTVYTTDALERIKKGDEIKEEVKAKFEFVGQLAKDDEFKFRGYRITKDQGNLTWSESSFMHIE
ncbi:hypothetical protein Q4561_09520 [Alteromonas sp. 1_MG-2023]|uniref:LEM-3-like GIY-YIG domain-containing protein n=1 Tax=Alteromonas sp. 1_MG-2023 TaxID=3062669 RepID=UPI0026E21C48|nr:hypothetical protein [Alteromonas sp. 1_MG-2023]MDO6567295.1 hypothetical protein [Alteromonas sp. 1_MG-2023]